MFSFFSNLYSVENTIVEENSDAASQVSNISDDTINANALMTTPTPTTPMATVSKFFHQEIRHLNRKQKLHNHNGIEMPHQKFFIRQNRSSRASQHICRVPRPNRITKF